MFWFYFRFLLWEAFFTVPSCSVIRRRITPKAASAVPSARFSKEIPASLQRGSPFTKLVLNLFMANFFIPVQRLSICLRRITCRILKRVWSTSSAVNSPRIRNGAGQICCPKTFPRRDADICSGGESVIFRKNLKKSDSFLQYLLRDVILPPCRYFEDFFNDRGNGLWRVLNNCGVTYSVSVRT